MNPAPREDKERHGVSEETGTGRDLALGAAFAGARAGATATRVVLAPVRFAARAPIVSSVLQRAGARLTSESRAARRQIETTATELLEAPELERTVDRVLAGPLPDSVAHSIGEHRVAERVAAGVLTTADLEAAVAAALDNERTQRIVEQVVDSAGLERIVVQVLESRLTVDVTERVLRSPELQQLIERIAASPEIRAALTHQTSSLAGEMVGAVRHRLERLDDAAERTIHRWLHRSLAASTGTDAYGGLLTRAVAFGIDIAIAGLITFVTIALLSLVKSLVGEDWSGRSVGALTGASWTLAVGLYLVFFWTVLGQTPAMRLMRLRVTDARGNPPSLGRSVLRLFGLLLAIVPMFAGFLPILFSRRRKGLQDFIANTTVVTTEDPETCLMGWIDTELVLVALAAMVSPTTLTFSVLALVLGDRPLRTGLWFYLGAFGITMVIGVIAAFVIGDVATSSTPSSPKTWVAVIDVVAAVFLLLFAVRFARKPLDPKKVDGMVAKMSKVASSPVIAVIAAGATLANPGGFIPIALKTISELDPSETEYIVDWLFFAVMSLLPLLIAIIMLLVAPTWTKRTLNRVRDWLIAHISVIAAVIIALLAVALLRNGIAGLTS